MYEDESPALPNGSSLSSLPPSAASSSQPYGQLSDLHDGDLATTQLSDLDERLAQLNDDELAEVCLYFSAAETSR